MSISVDDLVASLSSSHIGQEALDLAALQAQLAQTLYTQSGRSSNSNPQTISYPLDSAYAQPCNTPTICTPTMSFSWVQSPPRRRQESAASEMQVDDMSPEDPFHSPPSSSPTSSIHGHVHHHHHHSQMPSCKCVPKMQGYHSSAAATAPSSSVHCSLQDPASPLFTSTDPFYIAQLQDGKAPQSMFAQSGRTPKHSPFSNSALTTGF